MYIIKTPSKIVTYYKRNYIGTIPQTTSRHDASTFKSGYYANTIAQNLSKKHGERFGVELY